MKYKILFFTGVFPWDEIISAFCKGPPKNNKLFISQSGLHGITKYSFEKVILSEIQNIHFTRESPLNYILPGRLLEITE